MPEVDRKRHLPERPCRLRLSFEFASIFSTEPKQIPADAPKVLFIVPRGMFYDLAFMGIIARRLIMENRQPYFILCDNLPMCSQRDHKNPARNKCDSCVRTNVDFLNFNGFPYVSIWNYLEAEDVVKAQQISSTATLENFTAIRYCDLDIGRLQEVPLARYFFRYSPDETEVGENTVKQFMYSAVLLTSALERIIDSLQPESILVPNGKTSWASLSIAVAERRGIKTISYENFSSMASRCGQGRMWCFASDGPLPDLKLGKAWENWKNVPLTDEENRTLDAYLLTRQKGSYYYPNPKEGLEAIEEELGMELKSPVVTLFSNVVWDTNVLQKDIIFPNIFEWIVETIRAAKGQPYTLLIRIHPCEAGLKAFGGFASRQPIMEEIHRRIPELPGNVRIIPPDSNISSYTLMSISEVSLVYTSTVGLETIISGKPAIVCSIPHYSRRGFTIDIKNKEEYLSFLRDLSSIPSVTQEQVDLARRYTYLFFFRYLIPLPFYGVSSLWNVSHYCLTDIDEIRPGRNPYLDIVIDGILNDGDFTIPRQLNCYEALKPRRIKDVLPIVSQIRTLLQKEANYWQTLAKDADYNAVSNELQSLEDEFSPRADVNAEDVESLFIQAQSAAERYKIDIAVEQFEEILKRDQNHTGALESLAKILLQYERPDDAEILLRRVLRINPTSNSSWQCLINVYKNKNNIPEAMWATTKWLTHKPDHIPALLQAAAFMLEYGEMVSLRKTLEKICHLGGHPAAERLLASMGLPIPQCQYEQGPHQIGVVRGTPYGEQNVSGTEISNKHSLARERNVPDISVLLCSFNRADTLKRCLDALEKQTLSRDRFEVVCVNDGSADYTRDVMQEALERLPGSYHEHANNRGLAAARNTAIRSAKGTYLLFINDDTYPEPDLLEQHLQMHQMHNNERVAVLGNIPFAPEHAERILSQALYQYNRLFPFVGASEGVPYDFNYFVTGNLSIARQAFISVLRTPYGEDVWFDETFRRYGCEDIEVGYRLFKRGYKVYYCPRAKVIHDHRITIHDYQRREVANSSNLVQFLDKHPDLVPRYLGLPRLTEAVLTQWRQQIEQQAPVIEKMIDNIAVIEDITPEVLAALPVTPSKTVKCVEKIGRTLQYISRHIKQKTILQILDNSPDVRRRLVDSICSQQSLNVNVETNPLVSVVIPCYNYACYLPEAVSSVLNQTYRNYEIIIVNDGSPDNTKEVAEKLIAEYSREQIRLINQANSGQPAIARNRGISEAKGEYILPLDADDKLAPQAIESYIMAVRDYPGHPVVAFGWLKNYGVSDNIWKTQPFSHHQLLRRNLLAYCSMYHRSVWKAQNGYSTNVPGYEDWDFWIGAAKMGAKFINIPSITTFYRETDKPSLLDDAIQKHEWLIANIISNHFDIYEDQEVAWATDYLERFTKPPKEREIHGPADKFPTVSAVLIINSLALYTPEEIAWAIEFLQSNPPFKISKAIKATPANSYTCCESQGTKELSFIKSQGGT